MLVYLDQIGDKKLKAPSTEDAVTSVYASSTASMRTAGGLSVEKRIMAGQFFGRVPLGGVIPVLSTFTASNNGGGSPSSINALIPASGEITDDGFQLCDGSEITATVNGISSPFAGRFVPNITDDRFIQGSLSSTSLLSSDTGVNNGNNTVTLSTNELPGHNHGVSIDGSSSSIPGGQVMSELGMFLGDVTGSLPSGWEYPGNGTDNTVIPAAPDQTTVLMRRPAITVSSHSHSVSQSSVGGSLPFDIRPRFISGKYLMRVI
jgi:hypothetical protein